MEEFPHNMHNLFLQLGEPNDEESIRRFIAEHRSLPGDVPLHLAPFWSDAQAQFLQEAVTSDADWAVVVDELSVSLRAD
jgi:hypothetical protein